MLVPGAGDLAGLHQKAMPQKDQLCGPFWGALVLEASGRPAGQDDLALHAGTTRRLSPHRLQPLAPGLPRRSFRRDVRVRVGAQHRGAVG